MIYWVAATFKPMKKKDEEEPIEELIINPEVIMAKNEQSAAMKITMDKAEVLKKYDHDRVTLYVRPF
jgi:hypothetical protein